MTTLSFPYDPSKIASSYVQPEEKKKSDFVDVKHDPERNELIIYINGNIFSRVPVADIESITPETKVKIVSVSVIETVDEEMKSDSDEEIQIQKDIHNVKKEIVDNQEEYRQKEVNKSWLDNCQIM